MTVREILNVESGKPSREEVENPKEEREGRNDVAMGIILTISPTSSAFPHWNFPTSIKYVRLETGESVRGSDNIGAVWKQGMRIKKRARWSELIGGLISRLRCRATRARLTRVLLGLFVPIFIIFLLWTGNSSIVIGCPR